MLQQYRTETITDLKHRSLSVKASTFAILLNILFGANAVAIKVTLTGLGVFTAAGMRFSISVMAIYLYARISNQPIRIKKGQAHQLFINSILFVTHISMFYIGLNKTNASRGTLLINLLPFFILILSHFFIPEDRINNKKFLGIMLGFIGVVFVFLEKKGITNEFRTGDVIILSSAFIWAFRAVYTKRIIENYKPFQIVFYSLLFSIPLLFLGAFLFDTPMISFFNSNVILSLWYQGLITGAFGFVAWNQLLQRYGVTSLHTFIFIMPVAGVILGGLILMEPITVNILTALCLIGIGILVAQRGA
jgi:drug/metabolite transporter (DMT)-like permease